MNREFSFLDFLTILSFVVGVYALELARMNLEENRIQSKDSEEILYKLDEHLKEQDKLLGRRE